MRVVLIDAYNMMHRSRFGFVSGPNNVIFNFFRGLRPLIEKFSPDKVYFVLEGNPAERLKLYPEYKANRRLGLTPQKQLEIEDFKRQKKEICDLIKRLPIESVYHPYYECDDVIANLVKYKHKDDKCVILSNDTDFIQLYNDTNNVSIYSPVNKDFLSPTEYDYVAWKALVGDSSDNIRGVPRVGKKTAEAILSGDLKSWLNSNKDKADVFNLNVSLIKFADLSLRMDEIVSESSQVDYEYIKSYFNYLEFFSITKEPAWNSFVKTFSSISLS